MKIALDQIVHVLFYDNSIYSGKVTELIETPLAKPDVSYRFEILIESMPLHPVYDHGVGPRRIRSSDWHLEPNVYNDRNIKYTFGGQFSEAFVFLSLENAEQYIKEVRRLKREYHLRMAESLNY